LCTEPSSIAQRYDESERFESVQFQAGVLEQFQQLQRFSVGRWVNLEVTKGIEETAEDVWALLKDCKAEARMGLFE